MTTKTSYNTDSTPLENAIENISPFFDDHLRNLLEHRGHPIEKVYLKDIEACFDAVALVHASRPYQQLVAGRPPQKLSQYQAPKIHADVVTLLRGGQLKEDDLDVVIIYLKTACRVTAFPIYEELYRRPQENTSYTTDILLWSEQL